MSDARTPVKAKNAASMILRASPGNMHTFSYYNSSGSTTYLLMFDATTVPTNGTVPDYPPIPVTTKQNASANYGTEGFPFVNGMVLVHSSTDTTLTIAGTDGFFAGTFT